MSKQNGWTLIELIVVLVIVSILVFVMHKAWPGKAALVRAEAQQLAQHLRSVRQYAVAHDESVRLNFDTAAKSYQFTDSSGTTPIQFPSLNNATVSLDGDTTLTLVNLPNSYLLFDKNGKAFIASDLALSADATITLAGSGVSEVVTVKAYTGAVDGP